MAEVWTGLHIWVWRMKRKLKKAKATSEKTAKKPEELGISADALEKLKNGKLKADQFHF